MLLETCSGHSMERKLAAILAADVVGYSRLMGQDEAGTLSALKSLRSGLVDPKIAEHKGRVFKTTGDGLLAEFPSVVSAVACAVEVQRGMTTRVDNLPAAAALKLRIGVNVGDVIVEGEDIFGEGVNIAARLEPLADAGGICISAKVHEEVKGKITADFEDLGPQTLKNIADPVRAFRVRIGFPNATPARPTVSSPEKSSIAVLPFTNLSNDPEQQYFSDGIADDIITGLSKIADLFVTGRHSSFAHRDASVPHQQISRELSVKFLLIGSIRKSGERVRITAQLVDGTTGQHLWADRYDRSLTDIFAVQDEVTSQIVDTLAVRLSSDERLRVRQRPTKNLEAYDCFLRGNGLMWLYTRESNLEACKQFERAIQLDPHSAPAHALLSHGHLLSYINKWDPDTEGLLRQSLRLAAHAVSLNAEDHFSHWQLGLGHGWNHQQELNIQEQRRAIALNPNFAPAHAAIGRALTFNGQPSDAIQPILAAMKLEPAADIFLHFLGEAYFYLDRHADCEAVLKRRIYRMPETDASRVLLAASYGHTGRLHEAREVWRSLIDVNPDYSLEHRRSSLPFKNPADFDRIVDGLRKAGLPGP